MTTDNFCFYLQNRLIQASNTGGQWYSDTSPFSIPWFVSSKAGELNLSVQGGQLYWAIPFSKGSLHYETNKTEKKIKKMF